MDVFYYLHRGYDFDFIHAAMPSLTREQFDAVQETVQHLLETAPEVSTFKVHTSTAHKVAAEKAA